MNAYKSGITFTLATAEDGNPLCPYCTERMIETDGLWQCPIGRAEEAAVRDALIVAIDRQLNELESHAGS